MKLCELYSNKPTIFLDSDGVLADFEKAVIELHGPNYKNLHPITFWRPITKEIDNFFSTLSPMNDAVELAEYVKDIDGYNVKVLTALPRPTDKAVTAGDDKTKWIQKHIDSTLEVITVIGGKNKAKYCKSPEDILIDDTQRNIDAWKEAGGIGILHTSTLDTIKQLEEIIYT